MPYKAIFGTLIFMGCCALGFRQALRLEERTKALQGILAFVNYMERGVRVQRMQLPDIFAGFALGNSDELMGSICARACAAWQGDDSPVLPQIWQKSVADAAKDTSVLKREDIAFLQWIGEQATQGFPGEFFEVAQRNLYTLIDQSRSECAGRGKLYRSLGGLCGAALFIIIL